MLLCVKRMFITIQCISPLGLLAEQFILLPTAVSFYPLSSIVRSDRSDGIKIVFTFAHSSKDGNCVNRAHKRCLHLIKKHKVSKFMDF